MPPSGPPARPLVVLGFLGSTLDVGQTEARWERWRPTLGLCMQEDLLIGRLELFYDEQHAALLRQVQEDIRQVSPATQLCAHPIHLSNPWDFEQVYGALFDFAVGYRFDTEAEDYLVHITTGTHVAQICLFLLTESRHFPARLVQTGPGRRGARSPAGHHSIIDLDLARYDSIAMRRAGEARADISFLKAGIETRNPAFNALIEQIEHVALRTADPLLLTGPTGAGKSRLARRVYELKRSRHKLAGDFVEVNCATLRGDGALSALFGHKRGAFTGAAADRGGFLRAADGGMLFLDEIGELGLDEQALLLHAIETGRFRPLGSDQEVASRFELIAGTNRDLGAAVAAGRFREDLLARINLWTFRLPGLAERREDIEPNLDYELLQHAARTGTQVTFNREARAAFLAFAMGPQAAWRANFRDLRAAVTRLATLAPAGRIRLQDVEAEIARLQAAWRESAPADEAVALLESTLGPERAAQLDRFDQVQLAEVIRVARAAPSLSEAGRRLFAVTRLARRSTNDADRLRKYLTQYGLAWSDLQMGDPGRIL